MIDYNEALQLDGNTEFTGYSSLEGESEVIALLKAQQEQLTAQKQQARALLHQAQSPQHPLAESHEIAPRHLQVWMMRVPNLAGFPVAAVQTPPSPGPMRTLQ